MKILKVMYKLMVLMVDDILNISTLRKLAHAIYRDFLALKIENFLLKNFDIFLIFAQNIDCEYTLEPPRRGGSNEYPQSMFWSKNKKDRYTPAYPSFVFVMRRKSYTHFIKLVSLHQKTNNLQFSVQIHGNW